MDYWSPQCHYKFTYTQFRKTKDSPGGCPPKPNGHVIGCDDLAARPALWLMGAKIPDFDARILCYFAKTYQLYNQFSGFNIFIGLK
jgi:hypothetical protein